MLWTHSCQKTHRWWLAKAGLQRLHTVHEWLASRSSTGYISESVWRSTHIWPNLASRLHHRTTKRAWVSILTLLTYLLYTRSVNEWKKNCRSLCFLNIAIWISLKQEITGIFYANTSHPTLHGRFPSGPIVVNCYPINNKNNLFFIEFACFIYLITDFLYSRTPLSLIK